MNEKKKCPNCHLLIDSDLEKCPYCGYILGSAPNVEHQNESKKVENNNNDNMPQVKARNHFFKFEERRDVSIKKELLYFFLTFIGLDLFALAVQLITLRINAHYMHTVQGSAMTNFMLYLMLGGVFLMITLGDFKKLFYKFNKIRTYLYGISYGLLVIIVSSLYSMFARTIYPGLTSNDNESTIDAIVNAFPLLSLLVFGFLGPMCEEMAYRVGLFSFVRRKNRILAYVVTGLIFGFIHFDFQSTDLITEFLNLPSYILSGLLFCYIYDKEGVETSMVAHVFNNVLAISMTILGNLL